MEHDMDFCPFCGGPGHKIVHFSNNVNLCKECSGFFKLDDVELTCPRCDSTKIGSSDFPSPAGEIILQCKGCKKMFDAKELFEKNKM